MSEKLPIKGSFLLLNVHYRWKSIKVYKQVYTISSTYGTYA